VLASVALPRMFSGINEAEIAKIKSNIATVRAAIATKYGKNIIQGKDICPQLESINDTDNKYLFENILTYPIKKSLKSVKWDGNGSDYNVSFNGNIITFKYKNTTTENCKFECQTNCDIIDE